MGAGRRLSPLLANNRSESPLRQERACAAHGTAGRAQQPGCGPCPGGAAAGSHRLLFPALHSDHTGGLNEANVRGPHPLGAGTPAFITLPPGVSRQGQTSQQRAWSHTRADEARGPAASREVVCQADQSRSRHTGDTGRTGPLGLHCLIYNMQVTST